MSSVSSIPLSSRFCLVRDILKTLDIDGVIVGRGDNYLGEYVAPCSERLAWLTGFTGSAGTAVLLHDKACVFSDGRYTIQMDEQVDRHIWDCQHSLKMPVREWLSEHAHDKRIGYDPRLVSENDVSSWSSQHVQLVALSQNPIDQVWHDQPSAPARAIKRHPLTYAGETSVHKRERLAQELQRQQQDVMLMTDCTSLAWLLNIRGDDIPMTPVAHGYALLHKTGHVELFVDHSRLDEPLDDHVAIYPPHELEARLSRLAHKVVRMDQASTPIWFRITLEKSGAIIEKAPDLCALPKAIKNKIEQDGNREAHKLDSLALIRFLHWIDQHGVGQRETELADQLEQFRAVSPHYRGQSFETISAVGPNGAYPHYRAEVGQDRILENNNVYLVDSGAQYPFGTTDITRTIWVGSGTPPSELKDAFTRVLKGHIALAQQRFPEGLPGYRLDTLARSALWNAGLDYDHGTGHGIGSYLSVHEGPQSISSFPRPIGLQAGMIVSNEPGYYAHKAYGIRIENLMLIQESSLKSQRGTFLDFDVLTHTPIDRRLIDVSLLQRHERVWLNHYHKNVENYLTPLIEKELSAWLQWSCAEI